MATKKEPTTVTANGKVVNVRDITWPHDKYGITTLLRKEGARAIGRIKGDDAKMEVVMQTLKVLAQHATAKIEQQKADKEAAIAAAENMRLAAEARVKADAAAEVKRLERDIAAAKEKVKKLAGIKDGAADE